MADYQPGLFALRGQTFYLSPDRGGRPRSAMGPVLAIGVRREAGHAVVTVAGELDIATMPWLREQLSVLVASGGAVIADLDRVCFIDAAGLGVLAGAAGRAAAHGGSLHVVCARGRIRQLFRLTGLDRSVPLAATLAETLQMLAAGPDTPASGTSPVADPRAGPGLLLFPPLTVMSEEPEAV
jgi:anti-sigma B factor antagonist